MFWGMSKKPNEITLVYKRQEVPRYLKVEVEVVCEYSSEIRPKAGCS